MKKIIAKPLIGVGDVKFGMNRAEVRSIFGEATEFRKSKFSKATADDFGFCHVFYNVKDECEAIEIFNDIEVVINNTTIFPSGIEKLKRMCADLLKDGDSYTSVASSIGVYAPGDKAESILFAAQGYYE